MRTAVLIVGEYREFKIAINSWNFIKNNNIDYFISTWEESNQEGYVEKITEKDFTNYLPNIKDISIHPKKNIHISDNGNVDTIQAFRFNWMHSYETLVRIIEAKNLKYDAMLIIRPDLWLSVNQNFLSNPFIENLKENTIYYIGPKKENWVNDLIFFGKFNVMFDFLSKAQYNPIEHNNIGKLLDENFKSDAYDGGVVIVRPTARNLKKINYNNKTFKILDDEFTKEREIKYAQKHTTL